MLKIARVLHEAFELASMPGAGWHNSCWASSRISLRCASNYFVDFICHWLNMGQNWVSPVTVLYRHIVKDLM
jgi:hypothetical protein